MNLLLKIKRKDPICETTQKKGKGREKHGEWFCSKHCIKEYEKKKILQKKQLSAEL